jgi:hypothetical protein
MARQLFYAVSDGAFILQQSARDAGALLHAAQIAVPVVGDPRRAAEQIANCNFFLGWNRIGLAESGFTSTFGFLNSGR